ncbi:MAG: TonB-dependent receptor plug [Bacteroidetes bacterium OLB11]|nr:MAG: TonB-dependent receptor plug [Bacteroidetes bacterium OLB11]
MRFMKIYIVIFITTFVFVLNINAQQYILKGKVTDANMDPLSFVTVQVKGLQIGTHTDDKGNYQFQLEEGEYELVFSMLGYQKVSIKTILKKRHQTSKMLFWLIMTIV